MTGRLRTACALLAVACMCAVGGAAQTEAPDEPTPISLPQLLELYWEELDLDASTREQVRQLVAAATQRGDALRVRLHDASLRMRAALEAADPDVDAVLALADEVGGLRLAIEKNRLRGMLEIRALLTAEQKEKLARMLGRPPADAPAAASAP